MSVRPLTPELAEKARIELNENEKSLYDDLQHIRDWVAKQPHLQIRTDDQWLIAFLRGSKFSLVRTKEKLDLFYSIRIIAPDLYRFKHTDPTFMELLNLGAIIVLPKTATPDSPRVTLFRPGKFDPDRTHISDIMSISHFIQKMLIMNDDNSVVAGNIILVDLENVTMGHFLQLTPFQLKKMVVATQDAVPVRFKGGHFMNTPPGFETVFNGIKSLLNEKNKSRLFVHNKNFDELYKHVPKDVMPAEYGGNTGTIQDIIGYWKEEIAKHDEWLKQDEQFGTDESKRPGGKPKTAENMFGVEGSFRQLQFD